MNPEACMEAVAEMNVFVRQPPRVEQMRIRQAPLVHHGRAERNVNRSPSGHGGGAAGSGRDRAVPGGCPRQGGSERIETHRFENVAGQQFIAVGARRPLRSRQCVRAA